MEIAGYAARRICKQEVADSDPGFTACEKPCKHACFRKRSVGRRSGEQRRWVAACVGGEELGEVVEERAVL